MFELHLYYVLCYLHLIVLFPFVNSDRTHLINVVVLPRLGIFEESGGINQQTLHLLLSLSKSFMHTVKVALQGTSTSWKDTTNGRVKSAL